MKNGYKEEYPFKITVITVGADGKPENCRNGHMVGDTYTCEYGCPISVEGTGGFCSKSMAKLFPLMEAICAGGDLSNLTFKLEAIKRE
ncbi:MAG TPA: hypothetical protein DDZ89_07835 [Clostridiales bacterium]|nr:hypothetical protein [Clostridiales bacterium]